MANQQTQKPEDNSQNSDKRQVNLCVAVHADAVLVEADFLAGELAGIYLGDIRNSNPAFLLFVVGSEQDEGAEEPGVGLLVEEQIEVGEGGDVSLFIVSDQIPEVVDVQSLSPWVGFKGAQETIFGQ